MIRQSRARAWLDQFRQDIRHAFRAMRRNPGFTAVAVVTLALGTGANTAIFSVVDAVLLTPLPYPDSDRLVTVWGTHRQRGRYGTSLQDYEDWRARNRVFADIGVHVTRGANLTGDPEPEKIRYTMVSPSLLRVLGVAPRLGRGFADDENLPGRDGVALISDGLWRRRFGADPAILGKTLRLDDTPLTIVGVMPERFAYPSRAVALWKPFGMRPDDAGSRGGRWVRAVARLAPGVSVAEAAADMNTIMAALAVEHPDSNRDFVAEVEPLLTTTVGSARPALLLVWGAVGLVLLIACVNVAGLLIARAASRERAEIAIRAALGASRARLARQLLTESLVLAATGAAGGLLIAWSSVGTMARFAAGSVPRADQTGLDPRVLAFTLGLAVATGVIFGVVPALGASRGDLNAALRAAGSRGTSGRRRLQGLLPVVEVALAVIVLVGAGLVGRSLARALAVDTGFRPAGLLTLRVEPAWRVDVRDVTETEARARLSADRARVAVFFAQLIERVRAVPGVERAAAINTGPLAGNTWNTTFLIEGETYALDGDKPSTQYRVVTPGWFETMGVPVVRGRAIAPGDGAGSRMVAVVNQALARAYFAGEDPIGRRVSLDGTRWYTIVGVTGDVPDLAVEAARLPALHVSFPQAQWGFFGAWGMDVFVRSAGDPLALAPAVREAVRAIDPALPVAGVADMRQVVDATFAGRRFNTWLLALFAALALALAVVGLYGVLTYSVARRHREIGIRAALGATPAGLLRLVVSEGAALATAGVAIGLGASLALARAIESQLFEVSPADPLTLGGVATLVALVAVAASAIPARRAASVDPVTALRAE